MLRTFPQFSDEGSQVFLAKVAPSSSGNVTFDCLFGDSNQAFELQRAGQVSCGRRTPSLRGSFVVKLRIGLSQVSFTDFIARRMMVYCTPCIRTHVVEILLGINGYQVFSSSPPEPASSGYFSEDRKWPKGTPLDLSGVDWKSLVRSPLWLDFKRPLFKRCRP